MDNVRCLRCGHIYEKDVKLCPNCDEALLDASAAIEPSDLQAHDDRHHNRKDERALLAAAAETVLISAAISHLSEEIRRESSDESGAAGIEIVIDAQENPEDTASDYQTAEVIDGDRVEEESAGMSDCVDEHDNSDEMGAILVPGDDAVAVSVDEAVVVTGEEAWVVPGEDEADIGPAEDEASVISAVEADAVSDDDEADAVSGEDRAECTAPSDDLQHLQEHESSGSDD
ncbi:MAG: hypothetical protein AB2L14_13760 [Candidatus Xenobiia bacterium LiM19]